MTQTVRTAPPRQALDPGERIAWVTRMRLGRLRPHIPFTVAFGLGAGARILAGVTYRPALLLLGDSVGYLLDTEHLKPGTWHPAGYSIFLWPFQHLHVRGAVAPIQHIMGLGVAFALYMLLLRLGIRPWVAALACVPILLDGYQIFVEQFILSETLFEGLVVAAFVVLLWRERVSWAAGGTAALLISLAAVTRVVGLVLIPIVLVYVVVRRGGIAAIASTIVAAAVPLLLYASWYNSVNGSFQLTGNTWITLYGRIAPFANCSGLQLPAEERVLCDPRPVGDRPGPNWYLFDSNSPIRKLPPSRGNELLQNFSARIILHRPWTYSRVVGREFLHYFGYIRRADRWEDPLMVFRIRGAGETLPGPPWVMVMANESVDQVYRKALHVLHRVPFPNPQPAAGLNGVWRAYQDVAVTPGPLLALAALLGLLSAYGRRPSRRRSLRAEGILLTVSGLALLLTPVATNVFDYRYLIPALPLLSAGGVIGATALYRRWSTRKAEPAGDAHPPS